MTRLDAPAPPGMIWLRAGRTASLLITRHTTTVTLVATAACIGLSLFALAVGSSGYSLLEALRAIIGEGDRTTLLVVREFRTPRIVLALAVGFALGIAGSVFQAITRNPLGSPDLIGFTMGAQTGILVAVIIGGGSFVSTTLASVGGGLLVGAIIYALSFRGGFGGLRLILAGIAVSAMLGSVNRWLIVSTDPDTAFGALQAITGSLAAADWSVAAPCTIAILVVATATLSRSRDMRAFDLGTDIAIALGTRVARSRGILILLGTVLVALATMAVGPIAFVALVAPHIARILTRESSASLFTSGTIAALLLLTSDLVSQTLLSSMPVGVVTAAGGGVYFMILLIIDARTRSAS